MKAAIILVVLLFTSLASAACPPVGTVSSPYDITCGNIGVRFTDLTRDVLTGCTSTDAQRWRAVTKLNGECLAKAEVFCANLSNCQDNLNSIIANQNDLQNAFMIRKTIREIGPLYAPYNEPGTGTWRERPTDYNHGRAIDVLDAIRYAALEGQGVNCGLELSKSTYTTPDRVNLMQQLNIHVQLEIDGKLHCRPGDSTLHPPAPVGNIDPIRKDEGHFVPGKIFVSAGQKTLLDIAEAAHMKVHMEHCGMPISTEMLSLPTVAVAERNVELSATSELQWLLFQGRDFWGAFAPEWDSMQVCYLSQQQHNAYHKWTECRKNGDLACAWRFRLLHMQCHRRANWYNPKLLYRDAGYQGPIDYAPVIP